MTVSADGRAMNSDSNVNQRPPRPRKYPLRCIECGKMEVHPSSLDQRIQKNHDGRVYDLSVKDLPVTQCRACGAVFFTEESDDRIAAEVQKQLVLLTPAQIQANIEALGLTQRETAQRLGIAPETLCRWLSGSMIQSRAMDMLLRAFFGSPEVRDNLKGAATDPRFGEKVKDRMRAPAAQSRGGAHPMRFPSLERHGQMEQSQRLARVIRQRRSVFALPS
jgi:transcriptional regulator with XRE-family HTH domain